MMKIKCSCVAVLLLVAFCLSGCAGAGASQNIGIATRIYAPGYKHDVENPEYGSDSEITSAVTEPEPENIKISFLAAGDNIIHNNIFEDARTRASESTPEYNFVDMYTDISELVAGYDIAFINQETPMAGREYGYSGYPNFNSPQDAGDALVTVGFDVVNIANNHMLDKWESGLANVMDFWKTRSVLLLGAFENKADYDNIRVYEEKGVRIAFLSYTYGTNGMTLNSGSEKIIPLINDADFLRQIALAKEAGDLVFVSIHWGIEDSFETSSEQRRMAQLMVDNGVDVIIGHHPHVVQEVKWAENSEGHKTLIIYSLGNLMSTMLNAKNMVGGLATFNIIKEGSNAPYIADPLFIPVVCHYDMKRRNIQIYQLEHYNDELAQLHGAQKNGKFTYDALKGFITSTISSDFLPDYLKN